MAEEVRVLLVRRKMKQTTLAERLGVNEMWLSRRLRGAQPLDLNDLQRIADVLEVDVVSLFPPVREGRLITTANSRPDAVRTSNDRSRGVPERPHPTGHPKPVAPDPSTRRPARRQPVLTP